MNIKDIKRKVINVLLACPVILAGFLGAYAGADGTSKNWRRLGVPVISTLSALIHLYPIYGIRALWLVCLMSWAGSLSRGYGIPDDPEIVKDPDDGSTLGKFWYNLFNGNHLLADIFTRGTIGVMECFSFAFIPIVKGNWLTFAIICPLTIAVNVVIGGIWHPKYKFKVFGKELSVEEALIYSSLTALVQILIRF